MDSQKPNGIQLALTLSNGHYHFGVYFESKTKNPITLQPLDSLFHYTHYTVYEWLWANLTQ
jgi:hypothetical protein